MEESESAVRELGRYRLVTTLGQGGMGTIHLAVVGGLGEFRKLLVLKELRRDLATNERFVEMFLQEAKLAARLNHPNVVHTLEAGQVDDRYFLAMEFLDGQPFSELVGRAQQSPSVPLELRLQVLCDVLAGLHYAHELCDYDGRALEIVHRDVSPQNVFVTYEGQVKVVDFGIAKAVDAESSTRPNVFKGKFAYAAPEQMRGQPVDRRTDIFAVGVMLWESIALRRFAPGPATPQSVGARVTGSEPRIAEVVPDVHPVLARICDKATSTEPSKRFSTAEEFRTALQEHLATQGHLVDRNTIGRFMEKKFASERIAMHQLIHARTKEDLPTSTVRPLEFTIPAEDDATAVADLSELVEVSRPSNPNALGSLMPPSFPATRRRRTFVIGGVGVAAACALIFALYPRDPAPAETTVPSSAERAAVRGNDGPRAEPRAAEPAENERVEANEPERAREEPNEEAADDDDQADEAPSMKKAAKRAVRRWAPKARRAPVVRTAPAVRAAPAVEAEPVIADKEPPAKPAGTAQQHKMGTDLRTSVKPERRRLDVANPFE